MRAMKAQASSSPLAFTGLSQRPKGLTVAWNDGFESFFHFIWLRDCCYCAECGDCYSSKRYLVPCDLSLGIGPRNVTTDRKGHLVIEWAPDGHRSRYEAGWLRDHCYDELSRRARRHKPVLWDGSLGGSLPALDFDEAAGSDGGRLELYRKLRDYGFVIVRNAMPEKGAAAGVARLIGDLDEATYGKVFDLTPSGRIPTLGNTTRSVPPHTDEPFRYTPPGICVLGCVRPADDGGDTILVDGFKLAKKMRDEAPDLFALLARKAQTFVRRHDGSLDLRSRAKTFVLDDEGQLSGVRIHTRSAGPMDLSAELVEAYYAAHHRLTVMMMAPENQVRVALGPGEAVVFDNHRVLHARTDFSDQRRLLQICSVAREGFHERLRLLADRLGLAEEARMVLPAGAVG